MIAVIVIQAILFLYYTFTKLVDLYPFNNVREFTPKERLFDPGYKGILLFIPPVTFILNSTWTMFVSLLIYLFLLLLEIKKWWIPYLFKSSNEWKRKYERIYRDTMTFLPPHKENPIPNLEKIIFHLLIVATFVLSLFCWISQFNK